MSHLYDDHHRAWQRRFDTKRLADRLEQRLYRERPTLVGAETAGAAR